MQEQAQPSDTWQASRTCVGHLYSFADGDTQAAGRVWDCVQHPAPCPSQVSKSA